MRFRKAGKVLHALETRIANLRLILASCKSAISWVNINIPSKVKQSNYALWLGNALTQFSPVRFSAVVINAFNALQIAPRENSGSVMYLKFIYFTGKRLRCTRQVMASATIYTSICPTVSNFSSAVTWSWNTARARSSNPSQTTEHIFHFYWCCNYVLEIKYASSLHKIAFVMLAPAVRGRIFSAVMETLYFYLIRFVFYDLGSEAIETWLELKVFLWFLPAINFIS